MKPPRQSYLSKMDEAAVRRQRAGTLVTLALLGMTAAATAAALQLPAAQIKSSSTVVYTEDERGGQPLVSFLWVSMAASGASAGVHLTVRISTRVRRWTSARSSIIRDGGAIACTIGALVLGIIGLHSTTLSNAQYDESWPKTMAAIIAVTWIAVAVTCVGAAVASKIQHAPPSREMTPALMMLRCACWSSPAKHLLVALPFITLATVAFALWGRVAEDCHAMREPRRLLLGDAVLFTVIVVAIAASAGYTRVKREQLSHVRRRIRRVITLVCLLLYGALMIAWVVRSYKWLSVQSIEQDAASVCDIAGVVDDVRCVTAAVLVAAVILLMLTTCCRLERHLLPVANTPQVDHSMLSPHAMRPPTRTDSV